VTALTFGDRAGRAHLSVGAAAAGGEASEHLAARHADAIQELPDQAGEQLVSNVVSGVPVLLRRYAWTPEGRDRVEQVALYRVDGDVAWVGILTAEQQPSEEQVNASAQIVGTLTSESPFPTRDYSVEELTALAELHGARRFPGVQYTFSDSAARLGAHRALTARGTLRPGDGALSLDPLDKWLIDLALTPAATVTIDHQNDAVSSRSTLFVGSACLLHTPLVAGVHRLTAVPTNRVGTLLGELTQLRERPLAPGGAPLQVSDATFRHLRDAAVAGRMKEVDAFEPDVERVREVLASVVSSSHLRVRGTSDGAVQDGDLVWLDADELGLWRIRPSSGQVSLEPLALAELSRAFADLWSPPPQTPIRQGSEQS